MSIDNKNDSVKTLTSKKVTIHKCKYVIYVNDMFLNIHYAHTDRTDVYIKINRISLNDIKKQKERIIIIEIENYKGDIYFFPWI
jgi:hypothetical protein